MMAYVLVLLIWATGPETQDYREAPLQRFASLAICEQQEAIAKDRMNNPSVELFCIDAVYYPNVK